VAVNQKVMNEFMDAVQSAAVTKCDGSL